MLDSLRHDITQHFTPYYKGRVSSPFAFGYNPELLLHFLRP